MKEEQKTEELKLKNWNRILLVVLVMMLMTSCSVDVKLFDKAKHVTAKELNAGPSSSLVHKTRKDKKSPSGVYDLRSSFRIKYSSDTVKAEPGANFGVEFILLAETKSVVKVSAQWTFPKPIVNEKGKSYDYYLQKDDRTTHERTYFEFIFREDYMFVKGEWKLELFHKKKKILEKVFYLI